MEPDGFIYTISEVLVLKANRQAVLEQTPASIVEHPLQPLWIGPQARYSHK